MESKADVVAEKYALKTLQLKRMEGAYKKKPPDSWVFIIFFQLLIEKLCATRTEIINNATGCTKSPFQLAFIEI